VVAVDINEDVKSPAGGDTGSTSTGLVDRVMAEVNEHIRSHGLSIGAPLPSEAEFAARAGVSRAVAREGFRGLAALKLIDVGNGRRARVGAADDSVISLLMDHAVHTKQINIQQILDARRSLELRTVVLAALRRTDREAAEISAVAEEMVESFSRPDHVMELDINFHGLVAQASRNPLFALLIASFRFVTRETFPIGWVSQPKDEARLATVSGHSVIAAAIRDRRPQEAEKAMADHFDIAVRALINAGIT
jgi:GntR family transcriptional regulator, transcriptional repressor for pyruvate dehydrogenase complex